MLQLGNSYSFPALFVAGDASSSYLAISDVDGNVHILSEKIELLYKLKHEGRLATALAICDDMVIIGLRDGEITTFLITSG
jgi:hypothetical protein